PHLHLRGAAGTQHQPGVGTPGRIEVPSYPWSLGRTIVTVRLKPDTTYGVRLHADRRHATFVAREPRGGSSRRSGRCPPHSSTSSRPRSASRPCRASAIRPASRCVPPARREALPASPC